MNFNDRQLDALVSVAVAFRNLFQANPMHDTKYGTELRQALEEVQGAFNPEPEAQPEPESDALKAELEADPAQVPASPTANAQKTGDPNAPQPKETFNPPVGKDAGTLEDLSKIQAKDQADKTTSGGVTSGPTSSPPSKP